MGDLIAQRGDRRGEKQSENWKQWDIPPAPALKQEDALKSFKIATGFRIELAASEPLVEDPVAITWDPDGRIWAVEMQAYMPNIDGKGEDAPINRVVVLEDTDGDGRMDKSTTFLDKLVMPRAIAMVEGGVLVAEPPDLWYCRDTDGDLKCDEKKKVARYARQGPVEHTENGLMRALDNWIYNAKSSRRFKFKNGKLIEDSSAGRGQWGITQDNYGRIFSNTNSSFLHGDYFPYHYLKRNRNLRDRLGINTRIVRNQTVYPARITSGINRGYRKGMLRKNGTLSRTTGTCGPVIYRGGLYPEEFSGNAFVPEPTGNLVSRFILKESGIEIKGDRAYKESEFLASTDERFRPINAYTGPDGCLYIVDLYRGILQHKIYVTSYLRKQILERGLDKPTGLGRIYRVVHESVKAGPKPNLSKANSRELVGHLSHPNGWWRDTAQRLLIEGGDSTVVPVIRKVAASGKSHLGRIHALWTLEGMDSIDKPTVLAAMKHPHQQVRIAAMRTGERLMKTDSASAFVDALSGMVEEKEPLVRLQAAFSLGEAGNDPKVTAVLVKLLEKHAADRYMRMAAFSGLAGRELDMLQHIVRSKNWNKPGRGYKDILKDLAFTIFASKKKERIEQLITLIARHEKLTAWRQEPLLQGIENCIKNKRFKSAITLKQKPNDWDKLAYSKGKPTSRFRNIEKYITWPGDTRSTKKAIKVPPRTAQQKKLMANGKKSFDMFCMPCHQTSGLGQAGLAPPMVNSPWILGSKERLIRIALDGVEGKINVKGEIWDKSMPSNRANLSNEDYAGLLTYIRSNWGHTASPVETATVKRIREATKDRDLPWTEKELLQIK